MSIYVKPCLRCREVRRMKRNGPMKDRRQRKACTECRWIAISPPAMDRRSLGVYDTKEQADAAYQEALVNRRRGIDLLPSDLTVSDIVERYLRDGTADLSVTTLHRYRELWTIHGSPLAKYAIAELRKSHVTNLYAKLRRDARGKRKPLNPRTVLHLHRVLHRIFEWAVEQDIIAANLFRRVKPPTVKDSDTRALSHDEARAFFEAGNGSTFAAFFQLAALTGARRGELVALKWDAVDLEAETLTIRTSLASTRAKKAERAAGAPSVILKRPKSGKSRAVPLDPAAIAVLRGIKAAQAADELAAKPGVYQNQGFVFMDVIGRPVKLDAPTKAFREVAAIAKLPSDVTLQSLRHSFASWSLANGADIVAVQRVLGHSVPSTTLNLYSHVVAGGRERAVAAVSEALRRIQAPRAVGEK
jgi:integrase